ncbi:hypothetical protein EHQ43_18565 [Leptospira bouyouniensis]|uniref:Uncharacterized protein n=1 Tax=Leptospira bouyouniensis TaxID=2484911 RepID=A0A7I0HMD9_9LEPT|nr:hypothetical protein EHQ43_18565 [Leptospira bouyouniensis]
MNMLISKDEKIKTSSVFVASRILKMFHNSNKQRISIFDISKELKKENITHYRQILFGLMFLYSVGIIDFEEPYIRIIND